MAASKLVGTMPAARAEPALPAGASGADSTWSRSAVMVALAGTLALLFAHGAAERAHASHTGGGVHFVVNNQADIADADTTDNFCDANPAAGNQFDCTLRAAVEQANAHAGADSMFVSAGTYDLDLGVLRVLAADGSPLLISGAGRGVVTIERAATAPAARIVELFTPLTLTDVTVRNGSAAFGGGILNEGGSLVLRDSRVVGNEATTSHGGGIGIRFGAATVVEDSIIGSVAAPNTTVDDGGGIGAGSTAGAQPLTITDSVIAGNVADGDGGGISAGGVTTTLEISGSTIADNRAAERGGGVAAFRPAAVTGSTISGNTARTGGGILAIQPLTVDTSTVSGNTSAPPTGFTGTGGIALEDQGASIRSSTIAGNGGGGFGTAEGIGATGGVVSLTNSVLDNQFEENCDTADVGASPTAATFVSGGHNLDSGDTCGLASPGDLVATEPALEPLADNGGPTETQALPASSPAIDAGSSGTSVADQRGEPRPADLDGVANADDGSDIGAFELVPAPDTAIDGGPSEGSTTSDATPTFTFHSTVNPAGFECRFDAQPFASCSGPGGAHTPASPLPDGAHALEVRAIGPDSTVDATPASRSFNVDTSAAGVGTPPSTGAVNDTPTGPTGGGTDGSADATPPDFRVGAKSRQKARKLKITVLCATEPCEVEVAGRAVAKRSQTRAAAGKAEKRGFKLKLKSRSLATGERERLRLKLKRHGKAVRKLTRLLTAGWKAKAKVGIVASDAVGNSASERVRIKLR